MYRMSFRDFVPDFDDDRTYVRQAGLRPAWAVVNDKSYGGIEERRKTILDWKNRVLEQLMQWREPITQLQRTNRMIYIGKHFLSQEVFERLPYNRNRRYSKDMAKIVVNFIQYLIDQHVADMTAYEPSVAFTPANDEEADRVAARTKKDIADFYAYDHKFKAKFQKFHRRYKVEGETFWFVLWDPMAGEYSPAYRKLRRMRLERQEELTAKYSMPLVDPTTGLQIFSEDGDALFVDQPIKTGDVVSKMMLAENVYFPYPHSLEWDDVPFVVTYDWIPVDEAKARWPQIANDLKADNMYGRYFPFRSRTFTENVCIRTLYHPPNRFLENGYYCITTQSSFCEEGRYPFDHGKKPCVRGTDIDAVGELHGISTIQNLASLQHALNNSTSMILQNQALFAFPKWAAPRGAKVRFRELDDDRGIYEYSGPKPPEVVTVNSTPSDTWKWNDMIVDRLKTLSGIYATSEGRAPDGITANVALRMIDEQERKFRKPMIDKHGDNVVLLNELYLSTLGTYRDPSDEAMIMVVGKNNERSLRYLDVASLSRPTEVRLQRTSGLPDSPAAKTQTVIDLNQSFPGLFSQDEVVEYLDLQRPEKLVESATVARQAAESEVEDLLQGIPVPPPAEYHDVLPRYRVYTKSMQNRQFDEVNPQIRARFIQHVMAAEFLIMEKMANPAFAQLVLQQFPNFPMFMTTSDAPTAPPMMLASQDPMMGMGMENGAPPIGGVPPEAAGPGAEMPPEAPVAPGPGGPLPQPSPPAGEPAPLP